MISHLIWTVWPLSLSKTPKVSLFLLSISYLSIQLGKKFNFQSSTSYLILVYLSTHFDNCFKGNWFQIFDSSINFAKEIHNWKIIQVPLHMQRVQETSINSYLLLLIRQFIKSRQFHPISIWRVAKVNKSTYFVQLFLNVNHAFISHNSRMFTFLATHVKGSLIINWECFQVCLCVRGDCWLFVQRLVDNNVGTRAMVHFICIGFFFIESTLQVCLV